MTEFSDGLRMAVGTLTIIPSGSFRPSRGAARVAALAAPLAALPLAAGAIALIEVGGIIAAPELLIGAAIVAWLFFGTRGMHLDATADIVDALAAGWDRERALSVLKRGDVGPMGAAALALVIIAQVVAWGHLATSPRGWLVVSTAVIASRAALTMPCVQGLAAMSGSTMGKVFAGTVPRWAVAIWWLLMTAALASAGAYAGLPWWQGMVAAFGGFLTCVGVVAKLNRVCGGVNGDVMGACIELSLTMMGVILACG